MLSRHTVLRRPQRAEIPLSQACRVGETLLDRFGESFSIKAIQSGGWVTIGAVHRERLGGEPRGDFNFVVMGGEAGPTCGGLGQMVPAQVALEFFIRVGVVGGSVGERALVEHGEHGCRQAAKVGQGLDVCEGLLERLPLRRTWFISALKRDLPDRESAGDLCQPVEPVV